MWLPVKLTLTALLWGGTFIAGRVAAQALPPYTAASGRYAVAVACLMLLAVRTEGGLPRLTRSQALTTAGLGLTGIFLYNVFFMGALAEMPAGRTALFVSLNPITTALLAALIFREKLGPVRWAGVLIALLGALIVITRGDLIGAASDLAHAFARGEIFMSLAVLSWASYTLISRTAMQSLEPLTATCYSALWGLGFLLIGAGTEWSEVNWSALLDWRVAMSLVYLGALGNVFAFIWYYEGIREIGPSRTAVFTNLVPAFAVLLSALILGEDILMSMVVGGVISILGVSLTNQPQRPPQAERPQAPVNPA